MSLPRLPLPKTRIALAAAALAAGAGLSPAVLAKPAAGSEFRVNTHTTSSQQDATIATDADGDFAIVWQSTQDGSGYGIYGQRYNAAGAAVGSEFRINTHTTGDQTEPYIAMDADGDFVVAWSSSLQDGNDLGVYAQRYNAAGVAQGGEFRVNTRTTGKQQTRAVAMDTDGDFVIAWNSYGQDSPTQTAASGVYAQRYNAAGVAQGGEFRVNTYTSDNQLNPAIAMDADGDFVVSWQSANQEGVTNAGFGVYAQRYNAAGAAQGSEFRVNTQTVSAQATPAIGMDTDGDFVIAWGSSGQDDPTAANLFGIYAQRYNAAGVAQGGEFRVNTFTTRSQALPSLAMDADGDFVISWRSAGQDVPAATTAFGVYGQRYNAAGVAQGGEFRINTFTSNDQHYPSVAMDADGDFVVAWHGQGTGDLLGVFAQRYQATTLTPSLTVTTSGAATNTTPVAGGPAGTYSFNAQFCSNVAQTMTGLSSKTLTLSNGNNLLNRTRDALAAPGAAAIPAGGPGTEKDISAANGYADLALASSECVTVPYQIGLTNRDKFNFTVRIRGDNGM